MAKSGPIQGLKGWGWFLHIQGGWNPKMKWEGQQESWGLESTKGCQNWLTKSVKKKMKQGLTKPLRLTKPQMYLWIQMVILENCKLPQIKRPWQKEREAITQKIPWQKEMRILPLLWINLFSEKGWVRELENMEAVGRQKTKMQTW